jgi:hypothetical protein
MPVLTQTRLIGQSKAMDEFDKDFEKEALFGAKRTSPVSTVCHSTTHMTVC